MDALPAYLGWLATDRQRSPNTVAAYRRDLESYVRFLVIEGFSVEAATERVVERYVASLYQAGRQPASIARALVSIRSFHRFLGTDAAASVGAPSVPPRQPDLLDADEVLLLLDSVPDDGPIGFRDRAMLEVLWATGARVSELVGLDVEDVAADGATLEITGPASERRCVPLDDGAAGSLVVWLRPGGRPSLARPGEQALFVNARGGRLSRQGAWTIVRQRGDEAGLGGRLRPQVLRRSCAVRLLSTGMDPAAVAARLGQRGPLLGYP